MPSRNDGRNRRSPNFSSQRREMAMRREKARKRRNALRIGGALLALALVVVAVMVLSKALFGGDNSQGDTALPGVSPTAGESGQPQASGSSSPGIVLPDASGDMETPHPVDETNVDKLGIQKQLEVNGTEVSEYDREEKISFGSGSQYTEMKGIITFRGNNYRDGATYGTANVTEKKLSEKWKAETGALGGWSGNGWVGQPLIVEWPESTRRIMNLHDDKKAKDGLVEVIYAGMDGKIHFYDLDDGQPTRDDINVGQVFKGSGALDPRGIPMIYLGGGDAIKGMDETVPKACIYSLVTGEKLYEFGQNDPFSTRTFTAWDSSALVSEETDTLIYPSENGILYTVKLNTVYDEANGKLTIDPGEMVKMRYTNARHRESKEENTENPGNAYYWQGMESSAAVWKNFLYVADNMGDLICVDLNTMKVIWAQDTLDDTNCSPVLEIEPDGKGYIYISTSLNWTRDDNNEGDLAVWKIDATTGEKVANFDYHCHTVVQPKKISGGVQATALLGKNSISDLVIVPVARTPEINNGMLYALDKDTLEERWSYHLETEKVGGGYSWSSPIAIYDENGEAYIILCNADGFMFLFDKNGELLDKIELNGPVEASPAAFGNTIVVGTRQQMTYAIEIK